MPSNQISSSGLTIQTRAQILNELLNGADGFDGLRTIYGADINTDPNTPDGQLVNLIAQAKIDVLEFIQQIFDSMDPDQAIGRVLDMRCAINGVVRKAGTYTTTNLVVTVDRALTINGLDTAPDNPFTVADTAGNKFFLVATHAFTVAGTTSLLFQAEKLGVILATVGTITQIQTIQLGVLGASNVDAPLTVGTNEESDYALRIRRSRSVSVPSKGYLEGLYGALLGVDAVTSVLVLENVTGTTDANGIPGHSIWCIVNGGTSADVAAAIYLKRNAGCGMKGSTTVNISQVDGTLFPIKFDRTTAETIWITFNLTAITGSIDAAYVRAQILANFSYTINQTADASAIVAFVKSIAPNCYVSAEGVSNTNSAYGAIKTNATVDRQWALAPARIIINGAGG